MKDNTKVEVVNTISDKRKRLERIVKRDLQK